MADIQKVIIKLRELKMPGMAEHLEQLYSSDEFSRMSSLEVIDELIEQEGISRKNHTVERRLKQALLTDPSARMENIDYKAERNINKVQEMVFKFSIFFEHVRMNTFACKKDLDFCVRRLRFFSYRVPD